MKYSFKFHIESGDKKKFFVGDKVKLTLNTNRISEGIIANINDEEICIFDFSKKGNYLKFKDVKRIENI